jgi:murein DD-endopeptidase MepM/ murein hydrolase activator NlpD
VQTLAYHGRHRPRRSARSRPTALGAGLVLPATATLVTVAVVGSGAGSIALTGLSTDPFATPTLSDALADAPPSADALVRAVEDRAARDSDRRRVDLVSGESSRRAAIEAALAANERVFDVATVPATGGGTEGAAAPAPAPARAPAVGAKAWIKPINSAYRMTSGFGARWGGMHPAQDFATPVGTPVRALSSGTVIFAGSQGGYGNKLEIQFWDGTVAWYAHNSSLKVKQGQSVTAGQVVAASGNTGNSTGPHVHLEIHPGGGAPVSPLPWLARHGIKM